MNLKPGNNIFKQNLLLQIVTPFRCDNLRVLISVKNESVFSFMFSLFNVKMNQLDFLLYLSFSNLSWFLRDLILPV